MEEIEPRVEMKGISNSASTHNAPDQNHVQQTAESCRKASADTTLDTTAQTGQTPCLQSRCTTENPGSLNQDDRTEAHDGAQPKDAEETQALLESALRQCIDVFSGCDQSIYACDDEDPVDIAGWEDVPNTDCVCVYAESDSLYFVAPELAKYLHSIGVDGRGDFERLVCCGLPLRLTKDACGVGQSVASRFRDALQSIASGQIVGEDANYKATVAVMRRIANEALGKEAGNA